MRTIALFLLLIPAIASAQSFRVLHRGDEEQSRQIMQRAEQLRRDMAIAWFDQELPPWRTPCVILWQIDKTTGHGATTFLSSSRRPRDMQMRIFGQYQNIMDDVLPHEVFHLVFRDYLGFSANRWMDEGACTTTETDRAILSRQKGLVQQLKAKRGIPLNLLMAARQYLRNIDTFYNQGVSLTRFLLAKGGKRRFVQLALGYRQTGSYTDVVKQLYGYPTLRDLQNDWLKWVEAGSPELIASLQPIPRGQAPFRPTPFNAEGNSEPNPTGLNPARLVATDCGEIRRGPSPIASTTPAPAINPPTSGSSATAPTKIRVSVDDLAKRLVAEPKLIAVLVSQLTQRTELRGADGQNGADGINGTNGKDGLNATDSQVQQAVNLYMQNNQAQANGIVNVSFQNGILFVTYADGREDQIPVASEGPAYFEIVPKSRK